MKLLLIRTFKGDTYTIGKLYVDGKYQCDTVEDADRKLSDSMTAQQIQAIKVYGKTAIPTGFYVIDMTTISPKFKDKSWAAFCQGKLPRLTNVKGYDGVLIHVGNKPEDTLGCILVGENKVKGQVVNSTILFKSLYGLMLNAHSKGEKITIEIK